jgi:hypothetical protein
MTQMPYVPMHPPKKELTQEDMWRTLAKHAPVPQKAPLEWEKPVKTGPKSAYILTRCGTYSVSKDASGDMVTYTAWKRPTRGTPEINLGCRMTADEAKALCEANR